MFNRLSNVIASTRRLTAGCVSSCTLRPDSATRATRQKVSALFPSHEVEQFTELFWSRIQQWRKDQKS
jgi:hypothetical protein